MSRGHADVRCDYIICGVLLISIASEFSESCRTVVTGELLDVGRKRGVSMNSSSTDQLTSRPAHAAKSAQSPDAGGEAESSLAAAAEYWGGRILWTLVILTSLWDIAVTFDTPSVLVARLF
jgi:hypothetical protein